MERIKLSSFWMPCLVALIGQAFHHFGQDPIAGVLWGLALMWVVFIFYYTHLLFKIDLRREVTWFLEHYRKLSPEEKAELGIVECAEPVKVEQVRRTPAGTYEGQTNTFLPPELSGARLVMLAAAIVEMYEQGLERGETREVALWNVDLGYGKWGGSGKLFSQPIWKKILEAFSKIGYFEKNGAAENSPYNLTWAGLWYFYKAVGKTMPINEVQA